MNVSKLILAVLGIYQFAVAEYVETFDSDDAGWLYGYGANYTIGTTDWNTTGGHPGGHISGTATDLYAVWTIDTAKYGSFKGLTAKIDIKISAAGSGKAQFYFGRENTYYISESWDISEALDWTTIHSPLTATHFSVWSGGTESLDHVLEAPDDIGIFFGGKLASGSGHLLVDNFGTSTIPEPAAMGLVLMGGVSMIGARRIRPLKKWLIEKKSSRNSYSRPIHPTDY